ncbi:MAG TPA: hypothetical protein VKD90_01040 [Gemmataceae bacterium]|nr:hypothetical protein [Gemmataceae bacterium]
MKRFFLLAAVGLIVCSVGGREADGRGFGGFRGGGFSHSESFSGSHSESFGRSGFDSFGGEHSSSFGGSRSSSYGGWGHGGESAGSRTGGFESGGGRAAGGSSYDRSYTGSRGGSYTASGERGFAAGPRGAAGESSRDVTATGPGGRSYSSSSERAAAVGPYGRTVAGSRGTTTASGARGTASAGWQSAFAGGGHMATDIGLSHYSSFASAGVSHATAFRSAGAVSTQCGFVRGTFGYYNAFHPAWYAAHPGAWAATGWAAGAAWTTATWATVASFCSFPTTPVNYDFGNTVVIQDNSVNVNGQDIGTPEQFAAQATTIADQGQKADATPEQEWKALGVFALVQGDATSSNNVFQLAVNKDGVVRGNYYDGLLDTTTPVYGSVDKKSQRAAWTIGKKNDRVFDAGISNLTADQCPVLVHIGQDRTQQWMLVRMQQPPDGK